MNRLKNIHPGEILKEDFLNEIITPDVLAKECGWDISYIKLLISGKTNVTKEVAEKLGKVFNVSAVFWLNIQIRYDQQS